MDEQETRAELRTFLAEKRPVPWSNLPDISLYMDQVISYLPRQLIRFDEGEQLTAAMVNNYSKEKLLPRADGKKYTRVHLAYLTAICALKQVLSVREMGTLLSETGKGRDGEEFYALFCAALDTALADTAARLDPPAEAGEEELTLLALEMGLRSYANKLACQRLLDLLQEKKQAQDKPKNK